MIKKLLLLGGVLLLTAYPVSAQTNSYLGPFSGSPATKFTCGGADFWYNGQAPYKPDQINITNRWYFTTTNILIASAPNSSDLVYYLSSQGASGCGVGSVTWTNPVIGSRYRFTVLTPTNSTPPPNGTLLPLTTVGFRTNAP